MSCQLVDLRHEVAADRRRATRSALCRAAQVHDHVAFGVVGNRADAELAQQIGDRSLSRTHPRGPRISDQAVSRVLIQRAATDAIARLEYRDVGTARAHEIARG